VLETRPNATEAQKILIEIATEIFRQEFCQPDPCGRRRSGWQTSPAYTDHYPPSFREDNLVRRELHEVPRQSQQSASEAGRLDNLPLAGSAQQTPSAKFLAQQSTLTNRIYSIVEHDVSRSLGEATISAGHRAQQTKNRDGCFAIGTNRSQQPFREGHSMVSISAMRSKSV
jgi:hypothetical protein